MLLKMASALPESARRVGGPAPERWKTFELKISQRLSQKDTSRLTDGVTKQTRGVQMMKENKKAKRNHQAQHNPVLLLFYLAQESSKTNRAIYLSIPAQLSRWITNMEHQQIKIWSHFNVFDCTLFQYSNSNMTSDERR